jgi:hypothetical protein
MDDISGKISEIFSNPESMETIKNLIGMLGVGGAPGQQPPQQEAQKPPAQGDMPFDPDTLMKMKKAFDLMRKDDPRVDFLLALKPNLSDGRRKKVDEAIHLLKLVNLIPLLQEGLLK